MSNRPITKYSAQKHATENQNTTFNLHFCHAIKKNSTCGSLNAVNNLFFSYKPLYFLTGHQNVQVIQLDLANLENIRKFATEIQEKFSKIDCLVCNAGVWLPMDQKSQTDDGFEMNVGVNHLGHFLLTNLLIGQVKRVVIVSSGLMMSGKGIFFFS